jgi:hypothetical protein
MAHRLPKRRRKIQSICISCYEYIDYKYVIDLPVVI